MPSIDPIPNPEPLTTDIGIQVNPGNTNLDFSQLNHFLSVIIGFLTLIAGLAFIFYFIIGAINLITSSGDPEKTKKGQQQMLNALIGIIITVIAYPIASLISQLLGIPLLNPSQLFSFN